MRGHLAVYGCTHTYSWIRIRVCVCVRVCVNACVRMYMHAGARMRVHPRMCKSDVVGMCALRCFMSVYVSACAIFCATGGIFLNAGWLWRVERPHPTNTLQNC